MIFYGWYIVFASFMLGFYVAGTIFYSFTAFIDPLVAEFGWSYTQVSFASSLRGLEMGIFAPLIGILVDRYGCRVMILIGMIIIGLSLVLLSVVNSLVMFYTCFILLALGAGGCTSVVVMAAVANWFQRRIGLALGIAICGMGASGLMIPLVVGLIAEYGWRATYLILGLGAWGLGIPLAIIIRNRPEDCGLEIDGGSTVVVETPLDIQETSIDFSYIRAMKNRSFLFIIATEAIRAMILGTVAMHVMPYLNTMHIPRSTAGLVAAGIPICSMIGRSGFGYLGDLFDKRRIMALTFALMVVGLGAFAYLKTVWFIPLFLLTFAPGFGGGMIMRGAMIQEYFGRTSFGKMVGLAMGIGSVAGIVGPTLGGWVFDTFGSYVILWVGFIGLSAVGLWLTLLIRPEEAWTASV
jgi:MFS family permease